MPNNIMFVVEVRKTSLLRKTVRATMLPSLLYKRFLHVCEFLRGLCNGQRAAILPALSGKHRLLEAFEQMTNTVVFLVK